MKSLWSSTQVCNRAEDVQGFERGGICEEDPPRQRCSRRLSICTEGLNTDDVAVVVDGSLQSPENIKGTSNVLSICTEVLNTEDVGGRCGYWQSVLGGPNTEDVQENPRQIYSRRYPKGTRTYCQSVLKDSIQRTLVWWSVWVLSICTWRTQYRGRWCGRCGRVKRQAKALANCRKQKQ